MKSCFENLLQLGILYALLGVSLAKVICSQNFDTVSYCDDGYYCCDDLCCSSGLTVGTIVGIVIGSIIVLAVIVGLIAACIFGCGQAKGQSGNVVNPQSVQAPAPQGSYQPATAPTGYNNGNNTVYPPQLGSGLNQSATLDPPPPYDAAPAPKPEKPEPKQRNGIQNETNRIQNQ